jgi:hypothetical protein
MSAPSPNKFNEDDIYAFEESLGLHNLPDSTPTPTQGGAK